MKDFRLGVAAASAGLVLASFARTQGGIWTNVQALASPPYRATEGLAFEPVSGLVVAYGGVPNSASTPVFSDTWAFDGCSWSQLFPAGNPGPRYDTYLAQSPNVGRLVLFGGAVAPYLVDGTTWELDTQALAWTNVTPGGPSPSPRQLANLVFDSWRSRTVLFGGANGFGSGFSNDTWEWDGTSWSYVTPPAGPNPVPRAWHSMTFDAARGKTVLFGGYNGSQLGDTWEWDGVQWAQVVTPVSPGPRSSGAIAYDPWSQRVVLFAGSTGWPIGLNDTWEYDGTNWYPVGIVGGSPLPQYLHRMVEDPVRGGILVYGAFGNGWSALNGTWRYQRAALTASPLNPGPGTTVDYTLSIPADAGLPYFVLVSLSGTCPGFPLPDGRVAPLNFDSITRAELSGSFPTIFQGFWGTLDLYGVANPALAIPPIPSLSGSSVSATAVTANGSAVQSLTNAIAIVVP
ncbi:MAG TPA: kelch repeat-containing protein [Planctomycetota bacterium]|jgi:hypothetical protein|nr:kelch repeat-containing protein [Planctomycetota bacterium]